MKRSLWPTRDSVKDYFPLPKEIFSLGLSAAEIAIYAYLLFTIRPIQAALQQDYDRQMQKLDEDMARRKYADFIENTG